MKKQTKFELVLWIGPIQNPHLKDFQNKNK